VETSPPKIRSLHDTPVNVPLSRPHLTASGVVESPFVLVELERDQGLSGHAYVFCYTSIVFPEISAQQLVAISPQAHWLEYQDWAAPILQRPLEVKDGFAFPQMETGCVIAWDKDAVERYRFR
jgi:mandelate racemase